MGNAEGSKLHGWQAFLTLLFLGISLIKAPYPEVQHLQHTPTLICIGLLFWASRRSRLSSSSLTCIAIFFWLHILGARWIYSFVPYDQWTEGLFGFSPSESMGWTRNHYDRFVHLTFGILAVSHYVEMSRRFLKTNLKIHLLFAFMFVGFASAAYEVFEWIITLILSPTQSENYNGQQGDFFDAQKDMTLAMFGAAISGAFLHLREYQRTSRAKQTSAVSNR